MLTDKDKNHLFGLYSKLYTKALPNAGDLDEKSFELAGFGLSENAEEFKKVGLGLQIVSEFTREVSRTLIGHTGKILFNLPGQFMPEHQHRDVEILQKAAKVPAGYRKLAECINDFSGIYDYNPDGSVKKVNGEPVYKFKESDYTIVMPDGSDDRPDLNSEFHFEGKSETFKFISGDAVLFSDEAIILRSIADTPVIPERFKSAVDEARALQKITTKKLLYMAGGTEVLLPKNTKHAILAGSEGAVYIEFSTPSIDEADLFTDERIIR